MVEGSTIVATSVVIAGTVLGAVQIINNNDGSVMTAIIGLWGTVLGYVFGKAAAQASAAKAA